MKKILSLLFIAGITNMATAQAITPVTADVCNPVFYKLYNSGKADYVYTADLNGDGAILAAGSSNNTTSGSFDGLLMKVNAKGEVIWSKTIGGNNDDYFYRTRSTTDGGCVMVGYTKSYGGGLAGVAWIVKADATGNVEWSQKFDDGNYYGSVAYNVYQTDDGGYAIAGTNNFTPGLSNAMVIKLDKNGNVLWAKNFNSNNSDNATGIIQFQNSLIVSSFQYGQSSSYYDGVVMKLDITNGNVIWARQYDIEHRSNNFSDIFKTGNTFSLFSLDLDNFNSGSNAATTIINMQQDGSPINLTKVSLNHPVNLGHNSSIPTGDGGYIVSQNNLGNTPGVYVFKINKDHKLEWTKQINKHQGPRIAGEVLELHDGYYNFVGFANKTRDLFPDSSDVYIARTDSLANTGCEIGTAETSVTTPAYTYTSNFVWASVTAINFNSPAVNVSTGNLAFSEDRRCYACNESLQPQPINKNAFILYPNPAKDYLLLSFKNQENVRSATVYITDMYGNKVLQQKLSGSRIQRISIANFVKGWYMVAIITADGKHYTQRFIKE